MKKIEKFEEVKEAQDFPQIEPGPKVVKIVGVEDLEDKEYLKIKVDIAHGDLKGEFQRRKEQFGDWPQQGILIRSYKPKALPFFKRFVVAVEKSNDGFKFDFDEQKLVGKYFVANYGEEEYVLDGEIKKSIKIQSARSVQSLKDGKVHVPEPKRLSPKERAKYEQPKQEADPMSSMDIDDDDLPF